MVYCQTEEDCPGAWSWRVSSEFLQRAGQCSSVLVSYSVLLLDGGLYGGIRAGRILYDYQTEDNCLGARTELARLLGVLAWSEISRSARGDARR
jgi:hypothetical protein